MSAVYKRMSYARLALWLGMLSIAVGTSAQADARHTIALDAWWHFARENVTEAAQPAYDDSKWSEVTLPHTFNRGDGEDGDGYYRGPAWYRRDLPIHAAPSGKKVWLQFDGAALIADVFVNGELAGRHEGGYARFRIDATPYLKMGRNTVAVRVDNSQVPHVAPLGGDFTVFGGLYRHVSLITTEDVQIDMLDHGGPGVAVRTSVLTDAVAQLSVGLRVRNTRKQPVRIRVITRVADAQDITVDEHRTDVKIAAGTVATAALPATVVNPKRWRGIADPYLYTVTAELWDMHAHRLLDSVRIPLGLRTIEIDADRGLLLNGQPYAVHGVNYFHSGRPGSGLAVTDDEIREDFSILKELGVTGVRFVHFQHPPLSYEEADRLGFIVWTEIPLNGVIDPGDGFARNVAQQMTELIRQNYAHPSIAVWGLGNEVYAVNPDVNRVLSEVQALAAREDGSRATVYAHCCQADDDPKTLHSDTIAFNRYFGWYPDQKGALGEWAENFHAKMPRRAFAISEYGAGASIRHQEERPSPPDPAGGWHPEQYQTLFHENAWPQISDLDFVWGKFVWVAFDLASDGRAEGDRPGINDKGLVTYDRQVRKDAYYYYQAQWSQRPMLHLTSKRNHVRQSEHIEVKAFTNFPEATLYVNGQSLGIAEAVGKIVRWGNVKLQPGANRVEVRAGSGVETLSDRAEFSWEPAAD